MWWFASALTIFPVYPNDFLVYGIDWGRENQLERQSWHLFTMRDDIFQLRKEVHSHCEIRSRTGSNQRAQFYRDIELEGINVI